MSSKAMSDFTRAVHADAALAGGLIAAIGDKTGGEAVKAFVAYAGDHGHAVTPEDVESLRLAARNAEGATAAK